MKKGCVASDILFLLYYVQVLLFSIMVAVEMKRKGDLSSTLEVNHWQSMYLSIKEGYWV